MRWVVAVGGIIVAAGASDVQVGAVGTVTTKLLLVDVEPPLVVETVIGPVAAPAGTVTVIDVDDEDVTVPLTATLCPVNDTEGEAPKLEPVIVTGVPTGPLFGLKSVMVCGGAVTVKLLLVDVEPLAVETLIGPVVAPAGTVTVIDVEDEDVTVPLIVTLPQANDTEGDAPKLEPVIVTGVPTGPLFGLKSVMVCGGGTVTVKLLLVDVEPLAVETVIGPVAAPAGTVTMIDVDDEDVTVPLTATLCPVNDTEGEAPKLEPVIVTGVPTGPLFGLKSVMVCGGAVTVKLLLVVVEPPLAVETIIGPVVAPAGTVTVIDVEDDNVTVPLILTLPQANDTEGDVPKFEPVIVTGVPAVPLFGLKSVMVWVA